MEKTNKKYAIIYGNSLFMSKQDRKTLRSTILPLFNFGDHKIYVIPANTEGSNDYQMTVKKICNTSLSLDAKSSDITIIFPSLYDVCINIDDALLALESLIQARFTVYVFSFSFKDDVSAYLDVLRSRQPILSIKSRNTHRNLMEYAANLRMKDNLTYKEITEATGIKRTALIEHIKKTAHGIFPETKRGSGHITEEHLRTIQFLELGVDVETAILLTKVSIDIEL